MAKNTGSRSFVNMFCAWFQMQSKMVKVVLITTTLMFSLVVLKYTVSDYNNFFIASESVHAAGIIALIYKLTTLKTCSGVSLQTQELMAIVLAVRVVCSFEIGHTIHTVLDIASLLCTVWVIYMIRCKLYVTYNEHLDKTTKAYLLIPCAIMATLIHPTTCSIAYYTKVLWAFCVYLEAILVLPQLHMMQRTKMIEPFTALYVFALGVSRFFGAAYWILRVYESTDAYLFLLGRGYFWIPMVLLSEMVQTFILADFCYYYLKSVVSGSLLTRVPRV